MDEPRATAAAAPPRVAAAHLVELEVGEWAVAPSLHRLWHRDGVEVAVEPRVMQVLLRLAAAAGRVVTRDELVASVWPAPHVSDDAVTRCISALRRALGDDSAQPQYVETIRKGGYRLVAPVRRRSAAPPPRTDAPEPVVAAEPPSPAAPAIEGAATAVAAHSAGGAAVGAAALPFQPPPAPAARRGGGRRWLGPLLGGGAVAAVAVLAAVAAQRLPAGAPAPRAERLLPATSLVGDEVDPALSPGGRNLAFAWSGPAGDNFDVYVRSLDGGPLLRLTQDPGEDKNPTFSPDGERIAFVRGAGSHAEVRVVPALGGRERRVATTAMPDLPDLAWSADGRELVFADRPGGGGPSALFALDLASGTRRRLTEPPATAWGDRDLAVSPDGRTLAFARAGLPGVEDLWAAPLPPPGEPPGQARRLTRDGASINGLEWSADGRRLLFSSSRDGSSRLWWIGADGGGLALAAAYGDGAMDPTRSGDTVAFERKRYDTNLWRLDLGGAGEPRPVARSTRWDHAPALSPDALQVAFVTDRDGPSELWLAAADGGGPRRLYTADALLLPSPAWSPDGRQVVVAQAHAAGGAVLLALRVADGAVRRLTDGAAAAVDPAVGRDGVVVFASDRGGAWRLWRVPLGGGQPELLGGEGARAPRRSPADGAFYFGRHGVPGLWRLGAAGAAAVVPGTEALPPGFDWDVGGGYAYFHVGAADPTRPLALLRLPLAGGALEPLTPPLEGLHLRGLGIAAAADDSFVLFGRVDGDASDLVLARP